MDLNAYLMTPDMQIPVKYIESLDVEFGLETRGPALVLIKQYRNNRQLSKGNSLLFTC